VINEPRASTPQAGFTPAWTSTAFAVRLLQDKTLEIDIGRLSPAFPVTPPYMRVRIRRFGGLSYRPTVNLGIPSESK
jgi:ribosomal protein S7